MTRRNGGNWLRGLEASGHAVIFHVGKVPERKPERREERKLTRSDVIEFSPWDPELKCPRCGGLNLHQGRVTVFDRAEDAELTAVTTVAGGLAATHLLPSDQVANPSTRRHGLAIGFDCEQCGDGLELTIAQHKGRTEFGWRFEATAGRAAAPA